MARRLVTIRWSLLRNLLLLITFLAGTLLALTFWRSKQAVRELCRDLIARTGDLTEVELRRFFEPVTQQLRVTNDWAARGTLPCREREGFTELLGPVLQRHGQISSANTGDTVGGGLLLLRDPDGWRNREVDRETWGGRVRWTKRRPDFAVEKTWWEDLDYDPRKRPWYWGAMATTAGPGEGGVGIHWTEPYTFFTTQDPGITAAVRTWTPDGKPVVVAYDVLLNDVSRFTMGLDVSPHGVAFVVDSADRLIGLPYAKAFEEAEGRRAAILKTPDEVGLCEVGATLRIGRDRPYGSAFVFDFECNGERWWAGLRPFELEGGPLLSIGVAVPESDFLGDFQRQRTTIFILTALGLALSIVLSVLMARRYSRPLEELAAQSERIRQLDTRPATFTPTRLAEFTRLHDAQERMRGALDSFARYVPIDVVRDLLDRGEAARIGGRTETLTIFFSDIEGFTSISERMSPAGLTAHMSEYFDVMFRNLRASSATIDKLIGDAIVAFWGAPNPVPDHARRAVEGVLACRDALEAANEKWVAEGKPPLPTRIGLATGPVVVGNVGTPARLHYTALGDTMNLASRLEGANKVYGSRILVAAATVEAAGDGFVWRRLDRVAVKGRQGGVDVYELLGREEELDAGALAHGRRYEEALSLMQSRRFDDALAILRELDRSPVADPAVQRLLHLCRHYRSQPPDADWDGVVRLTEK